MNVEVRQRCSPVDDLYSLSNALAQASELRLALQYDVPGVFAVHHETDVSYELQSIAERLLGVQQYGPSPQRLTVPLRLGKFTLAPRSL